MEENEEMCPSDLTTTKLNLMRFNLQSLPHEIIEYSQLEEIYAWENQISSTLPKELPTLIHLKVIVLDSNKFVQFPIELCSLPLLSELHLSRNQLTSIPNEFSNLANNLRVISFEYNFFKSMPQQFYLCEKLEELNFSANEIDAIGNLLHLTKLELNIGKISNISSEISKLTKLNVLSIEYNNLTSLPMELRECKSLKYLRAQGNDFQVFPQVVINHPNLAHTSIGGAQGFYFGKDIYLDRKTNEHISQTDKILLKCDEAHSITEKVFLGSLLSAKNKHYLRHKNVTDIITIIDEDHTSIYPNLFKYHLIRLEDISSSQLLSHFEDTYNIIENAKGSVLIHCQMGVSRSATITIAYVMKKRQLCLWEAYYLVHSIREIVHPNAGFIEQLKQYEVLLKLENEKYSGVKSYNQFLVMQRSKSPNGGKKDENCSIS